MNRSLNVTLPRVYLCFYIKEFLACSKEAEKKERVLRKLRNSGSRKLIACFHCQSHFSESLRGILCSHKCKSSFHFFTLKKKNVFWLFFKTFNNYSGEFNSIQCKHKKMKTIPFKKRYSV